MYILNIIAIIPDVFMHILFVIGQNLPNISDKIQKLKNQQINNIKNITIAKTGRTRNFISGGQFL